MNNQILNQTITAAGSFVQRGINGLQAVLQVDIAGPVTGTAPTLQFTLQQIDPIDGVTPIGAPVVGAVLTGVGTSQVAITMSLACPLRISWAVGGTAPSFGFVRALVYNIDGTGIAGTPGSIVTTVQGFRDTVALVGDKAVVVTMHPSSAALQVSSAPPSTAPGFSFGDVQTAATALVAVRRTTYNEQAADAQRSISSSSALDTAAGTGARTVRITYLTAAGAGPFTVDLTLNGVTAVPTGVTNICFIEKIEVLTAGATLSNAGILTLFVNAAGGGGTIGTIGATANQTFWNHHYVPAGKTCNVGAIWGAHTGTTVGSGATFFIRAKTLGVVNAIEKQITDSLRLYGQSSSTQRNYGSPIQFAGPARLLMYVTPETATSTNYRGSFDLFDA